MPPRWGCPRARFWRPVSARTFPDPSRLRGGLPTLRAHVGQTLSLGNTGLVLGLRGHGALDAYQGFRVVAAVGRKIAQVSPTIVGQHRELF